MLSLKIDEGNYITIGTIKLFEPLLETNVAVWKSTRADAIEKWEKIWVVDIYNDISTNYIFYKIYGPKDDIISFYKSIALAIDGFDHNAYNDRIKIISMDSQREDELFQYLVSDACLFSFIRAQNLLTNYFSNEEIIRMQERFKV